MPNKMTQKQAREFALQKLVPSLSGVFSEADALEWCAFLNYITDSTEFVACQINDNEHWANGWWYVDSYLASISL